MSASTQREIKEMVLGITIEGYKPTTAKYHNTTNSIDVYIGSIVRNRGRKAHVVYIYVHANESIKVKVLESMKTFEISEECFSITGLPVSEVKKQLIEVIENKIEILERYISSSKPLRCEENGVGRSYRARRNSRYAAIHQTRVLEKKSELQELEKQLSAL
jgi:hypothetical protein